MGHKCCFLAQLYEYKVQFGNCLVPQKYAANLKLGKWVSKQRREYRLYQEEKPSSMTEDRIRELDSVGFVWEPQDHAWRDHFRQLCEYKVQFGNCLVPQKYAANLKLRKWVSNQRSTYSHMSAERIRELESIEFM